MNRAVSRLFVVVMLAAGCGGGDGGGADLALPGPMPDLLAPPDMLLPNRDPADHPPLLEMTNNGGPVMRSFEIYTVAWQVDAAVGTRTKKFMDWMMTSDFYTKSLAEYGVGAGVSKDLIVLNATAPASLKQSDFGPIVTNIVTTNNLTINGNTGFSFIIPAATKTTLGQSRGCYDFGGYHTEATINGMKVPVMVNLQCDPSFDSLTGVVSHEVSEAATDPYPYSRPAYVYSDFGAPLGGEVADLCTGLDYIAQVSFPDGTSESYTLNRNWSNKAAISGKSDPCQPVNAGKIYFNVAPDPVIPMLDLPATGTVSMDIEIKPYAMGDVGPIKWQLSYDTTAVTITPDSGTSNAGETISAKITVDPDQFDQTTNAYLQQYGAAELDLFVYAQTAKMGLQQFPTSIVFSGAPRN